MDDGYREFKRREADIKAQNIAERRHRETLDAQRKHTEALERQAKTRPSQPAGITRSSTQPSLSFKGALYLIVIAVGLAVVVALLGGKRSEQARAPAAVSQEAGEVSSPNAEAGEIAEPPTTPAESMTSRDGENDRASNVPPAAAANRPTASGLPDRYKLEGPIMGALDSGLRVGWTVDGQDGFIAPSAPQSVTGGVCRTVAYGLASDPNSYLKSEVWCKIGGRAWQQR